LVRDDRRCSRGSRTRIHAEASSPFAALACTGEAFAKLAATHGGEPAEAGESRNRRNQGQTIGYHLRNARRKPMLPTSLTPSRLQCVSSRSDPVRRRKRVRDGAYAPSPCPAGRLRHVLVRVLTDNPQARSATNIGSQADLSPLMPYVADIEARERSAKMLESPCPANLGRVMNSCYSNLIEGHDTRLRDIALAGAEIDPNVVPSPWRRRRMSIFRDD
jgi:hypothetical protein